MAECELYGCHNTAMTSLQVILVAGDPPVTIQMCCSCQEKCMPSPCSHNELVIFAETSSEMKQSKVSSLWSRAVRFMEEVWDVFWFTWRTLN